MVFSAHDVTFEQVVEFDGPKPTIHFILITNLDSTREEALATTVFLEELALVASSVHASRVDQGLIWGE